MQIEHVAIWSGDIEALRQFYETYFGAQPSSKYDNQKTRFQSYFLTFAGGARLELMQRPDITEAEEKSTERLGYAHLAISVGSPEAVDRLTRRLEADGYERLSGPRRTGDGYYESVILDPDGNRIEITI
jgi:lactoylglutathione lyase